MGGELQVDIALLWVRVTRELWPWLYCRCDHGGAEHAEMIVVVAVVKILYSNPRRCLHPG